MVSKIYASTRYKRYFANFIKRQNINIPSHIKKVPNGIIAIDSEKQLFCVFDANSKLVRHSIPFRNGQIQLVPQTYEEYDFIDIDVVYLGNLEDHFGHFLLEHTNRAYPSLKDKFKDTKYVLVNNRQFESVPEFTYIFFKFLGIRKQDIIILTKTTRFKNVYVPDICFNIPNISSKAFSNTFNKVLANTPTKGGYKKIYVSRTALGNRKTFGEEKIQNIFAKNGYKIISPENLSLERQISLMKNCKSLAGVAGSALHLALFMPKNGTVIQLKRNRLLKDNSDTQHLICQTKRLDFILIDTAIEKHKTHHWSGFPQIIGSTKYLRQFLKDQRFIYSDSDLEPDEKSWQEYIKEFRKCGGFMRYQLKRMLVSFLPLFVPVKHYKITFRRWLNKNI